MGWDCLWAAITNGPIINLPENIWIYEPRQNDTDRGNPKNSETILSQYRFVYHKSHMDWHGQEPGSPRWEVDD
jgi:hypothetical protein